MFSPASAKVAGPKATISDETLQTRIGRLAVWQAVIAALSIATQFSAHEILLATAVSDEGFCMVYTGDCRSGEVGPCMLPFYPLSGADGLMGKGHGWANPLLVFNRSALLPSNTHWPFVFASNGSAPTSAEENSARQWSSRTLGLYPTTEGYDANLASHGGSSLSRRRLQGAPSAAWTPRLQRFNFPFVHEQGLAAADALRAATTALTVIVVILVLYYRKCLAILDVVHGKPYSGASAYALALTEVAVLLLHVPPKLEGIFARVLAELPAASSAWLPADVFPLATLEAAVAAYLCLLLGVFFRVYIIFRVLYWHTEMTSASAKFMLRLNHVRVTTETLVRMVVHRYRIAVPAAFMCGLLLATAYCVRNIETLGCIALPSKYACEPTSFGGALWLVWLSFATIGYSRPYVPAVPGSKVVLVAATYAFIVAAYLCLKGLRDWARITPPEAQLLHMIAKQRQREKFRQSAVESVMAYWRFRRRTTESATWKKGLGMKQSFMSHMQMSCCQQRVAAPSLLSPPAVHSARGVVLPSAKPGGRGRSLTFTFDERSIEQHQSVPARCRAAVRRRCTAFTECVRSAFTRCRRFNRRATTASSERPPGGIELSASRRPPLPTLVKRGEPRGLLLTPPRLVVAEASAPLLPPAPPISAAIPSSSPPPEAGTGGLASLPPLITPKPRRHTMGSFVPDAMNPSNGASLVSPGDLLPSLSSQPADSIAAAKHQRPTATAAAAIPPRHDASPSVARPPRLAGRTTERSIAAAQEPRAFAAASVGRRHSVGTTPSSSGGFTLRSADTGSPVKAARQMPALALPARLPGTVSVSPAPTATGLMLRTSSQPQSVPALSDAGDGPRPRRASASDLRGVSLNVSITDQPIAGPRSSVAGMKKVSIQVGGDADTATAPLLAAVMAGRMRQQEETSNLRKKRELAVKAVPASPAQDVSRVPKSLQLALAMQGVLSPTSHAGRAMTKRGELSERLSGRAEASTAVPPLTQGAAAADGAAGDATTTTSWCSSRWRATVTWLAGMWDTLRERVTESCKVRVRVAVRPISRKAAPEAAALAALEAFKRNKRGLRQVTLDAEPVNYMLNRSGALMLQVEHIRDRVHDLVLWDPLESTCRHASLSIL